MFNPTHIQNQVLDLASNDTRIRAVLLNGSRANPNVIPDVYQDFDLVFVVEDLPSFLNDRSWFLALGTPILQQRPDEMELGSDPNNPPISFGILTYFEEGYRIDLTLFPKEKLHLAYQADSLTVVWLDKDNLFTGIAATSDQDYQVQRPTQRHFSEMSNEFWWCVVNVAKGLKRGEITYAKDMMETVVRPVFMEMIAWNIGFQTTFEVAVGKAGKFMNRYLTAEDYHTLLQTYSDSNIEHNWKALFTMMQFFLAQQQKLADGLQYEINLEEAKQANQLVTNLYEA
ncbi:aminoglycoside 6-adenylyltransferase [Myroides odoratus]|uniref:Aminoglycoside 6-adenylyltransferase n=1 Tax=Myroides odoratus TaxID=256 RepID=A0A378RK64_MYROD|nr:aminoglycoside 6-adenylyltransferase [Myroides odoratus]QQU05377.1 aminoglycoside 6-adenylyltransferase [Myroides odoratus]STZ27108.1 Aminoglycoside 6-adenylyltransferase [Myroides odoratus]